jgi:hypothetical protein
MNKKIKRRRTSFKFYEYINNKNKRNYISFKNELKLNSYQEN